MLLKMDGCSQGQRKDGLSVHHTKALQTPMLGRAVSSEASFILTTSSLSFFRLFLFLFSFCIDFNLHSRF